MPNKSRSVFFLSDGTGITAEALGNSLLTQFEDVHFELFTIPYINNTDKAQEAVEKINQIYHKDGLKPLVFATLINPELRAIIGTSQGLLLDFFQTFIDPLEKELQTQSSHTVGKTHGLSNYNNYMLRINALNFALANDDGAGSHRYDKADIVLVGVSRCGKTPTCLYLALQYGIYAANYPFTEEDMQALKLPAPLQQARKKLFGLSIAPKRLHTIREERRPNSRYAALQHCQQEVREVEALFRRLQLPFLHTTTRSIEEIAAEIMARANLKHKVF